MHQIFSHSRSGAKQWNNTSDLCMDGISYEFGRFSQEEISELRMKKGGVTISSTGKKILAIQDRRISTPDHPKIHC